MKNLILFSFIFCTQLTWARNDSCFDLYSYENAQDKIGNLCFNSSEFKLDLDKNKGCLAVNELSGNTLIFNESNQLNILKFEILLESTGNHFQLTRADGTVSKYIYDQRLDEFSLDCESLTATNVQVTPEQDLEEDWGFDNGPNITHSPQRDYSYQDGNRYDWADPFSQDGPQTSIPSPYLYQSYSGKQCIKDLKPLHFQENDGQRVHCNCEEKSYIRNEEQSIPQSIWNCYNSVSGQQL